MSDPKINMRKVEAKSFYEFAEEVLDFFREYPEADLKPTSDKGYFDGHKNDAPFTVLGVECVERWRKGQEKTKLEMLTVTIPVKNIEFAMFFSILGHFLNKRGLTIPEEL